MSEAVCVTEGGYAAVLTRGNRYRVLAVDDGNARVQVRADTNRIRWFPASCFDMSGHQVPVLVCVITRDDISTPQVGPIEVDIELSDGQRRWCFVVTPEGLASLTQAALGNERLLMYGAPHMIVVSSISRVVIEQALQYIDHQNDVLTCTRLIE